MDAHDVHAGKSADQAWFRAKREMVSTLMKERLEDTDRNDIHILDIGAGTGSDIPVLSTFGRVYAVDINKEALDMIDPSTCEDVRVGSITELPYEDNTFDVVVAFDVLEHIPDHETASKEIFRVLKPGGSFVYSVPAFQKLFTNHDVALEHVRRYSRDQVNELLSDFGDHRQAFWNSWLFPAAAVKRLLTKNKPPKVDTFKEGGATDRIVYSMLMRDTRRLQRKKTWPFGLSIVGSCTKPTSVQSS